MTKICNDRGGSDKKLHVFVSFCIAGVLSAFLAPIPFPTPWLAGLVAFVVAVAVGIWKEVRDAKQEGNHFCVWDLAADVAGALLGSIVAVLANYYCYHDIGGHLI